MKAYLHNYRQSPRKVRLVAGLIRRKNVAAALAALEFLPKRAGLPVRKLLLSAVANAKQNDGIEVAIRFVVGEPLYFDVRAGFPRIIKSTISSEIFNCSYDVSLGSLTEFATNQVNTISRLAS